MPLRSECAAHKEHCAAASLPLCESGKYEFCFSALLKSLCCSYDVLYCDAVLGEQSLIRSRLTELILDTDSLDDTLAHLSSNFAYCASETVDDVVVFYCDDLADLLYACLDGINIKRSSRAFAALIARLTVSPFAMIATSLPSWI